MKSILPLLVALTGSALAVENAIPTAYTADRYETMGQKSPFALATAAPPPPAPTAPNFAASWYLTGIGRDEAGVDFITIASQDQSVHFTIGVNEAPIKEGLAAGVSLASVNWVDGYKQSTAIIMKGTETAKLEFSKQEPVAAQGARGMGGGRMGGGIGGGQTPVMTPVAPVTVPVAPALGGGVNGMQQTRGGGARGGQQQGNMGGGGTQATRLPRPGGTAVTAPVVQQPQQMRQNQGGNQQSSGGGNTENRRRQRTIGAPQ
jgi:hypothetical protein